MAHQTPKHAEGETHTVESVWGIPSEPPSPLHGQDWIDCQQLCACGESHPVLTVNTTFPIRTKSCSDVSSSSVTPADQGFETGDKIGSPKGQCFWGVPIPEGYEVASNSEASTPIVPTTSSFSAGEPRPDKHPARHRAWWSDFQNPEQALETFVRANETVEYFKYFIADGNSVDAKQNLGYLKETVPRDFAVRARKALAEKYSAVFPSLMESECDRMVGESLEWIWQESCSTGASLSEEDVIRFFKLEALVE